jgi:hypothetical protein
VQLFCEQLCRSSILPVSLSFLFSSEVSAAETKRIETGMDTSLGNTNNSLADMVRNQESSVGQCYEDLKQRPISKSKASSRKEKWFMVI